MNNLKLKKDLTAIQTLIYTMLQYKNKSDWNEIYWIVFGTWQAVEGTIKYMNLLNPLDFTQSDEDNLQDLNLLDNLFDVICNEQLFIIPENMPVLLEKIADRLIA